VSGEGAQQQKNESGKTSSEADGTESHTKLGDLYKIQKGEYRVVETPMGSPAKDEKKRQK